MFRPNGNRYIGSWKDGKQHNIGVFINMEQKTKRQGEWKNGKRINWLRQAETISISAFK